MSACPWFNIRDIAGLAMSVCDLVPIPDSLALGDCQESPLCIAYTGTRRASTQTCWRRLRAKDSQQLAALVEGLRKRIVETRAILPDWPEVDAAAVGGILNGIEDDLAAHGFPPPDETGPSSPLSSPQARSSAVGG